MALIRLSMLSTDVLKVHKSVAQKLFSLYLPFKSGNEMQRFDDHKYRSENSVGGLIEGDAYAAD